MSRLYLITGFLGAGKTTFLKKFVQKFSDFRMHVIVNEFGKEGIDGALIRELGMTLDEINNGSIFCSCRLDKFEEVLQNALASKPDVIIVETSGLSDPTNVRKILGQAEKFSDVEYMGCICLIDAGQFIKVHETATVVKKQLNVCDMLLLNKTDLSSKEQLEQVQNILKQYRPDLTPHETSYGTMEDAWLAELSKQSLSDETDFFQTAEITLRKYLLTVCPDTKIERVRNFLKMILDDTFRIKGFLYLKNQWFLVNCVGNILSIENCSEQAPEYRNQLVVLSGYRRPVKKAIQKAMEWYPDVMKEIEE